MKMWQNFLLPAPNGKTFALASDDKAVILWNLERVIGVDNLVAYGCNWLRDYLRTNIQQFASK